MYMNELINWLTHLLLLIVMWFTLIDCDVIGWLLALLIDWFIDWLIDWLIDEECHDSHVFNFKASVPDMIDWLSDWLSDWLITKECHDPPVSNSEASDPRLIWNCSRCSRNQILICSIILQNLRWKGLKIELLSDPPVPLIILYCLIIAVFLCCILFIYFNFLGEGR